MMYLKTHWTYGMLFPGTFDYSDPFIVNESWTEGLNGNILMYNQPNPRGDSDGSDGNRNMY